MVVATRAEGGPRLRSATPHVGDTVVLNPAAKGRSGSSLLRPALRELCALTIPSGATFATGWVPSQRSNADEPLRRRDPSRPVLADHRIAHGFQGEAPVLAPPQSGAGLEAVPKHEFGADDRVQGSHAEACQWGAMLPARGSPSKARRRDLADGKPLHLVHVTVGRPTR